MKYHLRNVDKIEAAYPGYLERIVDSLDHYFRTNMIVRDTDILDFPGEKYKVLVIRDISHSVNDIAFYILRIEGFTYYLAFKETIG